MRRGNESEKSEKRQSDQPVTGPTAGTEDKRIRKMLAEDQKR